MLETIPLKSNPMFFAIKNMVRTTERIRQKVLSESVQISVFTPP